jgi:hypothetical protein
VFLSRVRLPFLDASLSKRIEREIVNTFEAQLSALKFVGFLLTFTQYVMEYRKSIASLSALRDVSDCLGYWSFTTKQLEGP